jgi:hypothetical protein
MFFVFSHNRQHSLAVAKPWAWLLFDNEMQFSHWLSVPGNDHIFARSQRRD